MKIIKNFMNIPSDLKNVVLTVGNFDGVHLGHRKLLKRVLELSKTHKLPSVVLTFFPHPRIVLGGINSIKYISSLKETIEFLEKMNIDVLLLIEFTKSFAAMPPDKFWYSIIQKYLNPVFLVIGENHRFGRNKKGDFVFLQKITKNNRVLLDVIKPLYIHGIKVSSSIIRKYISFGKLKMTEYLLGRHFNVSSNVIRGSNRGANLGYPTANFHVPNRILPPFGVYVTKVEFEQKEYPSVTYIGRAPTFDGNKIQIETHIIGFSKMIYDAHLNVIFLDQIRREKHFIDPELLIRQIKFDIETSLVKNNYHHRTEQI